MPQRAFTNLDLDKFPSLKSKSRTFNNENLIQNSPPDILDDIEDKDNIQSPPDILDDEDEIITEKPPDTLSDKWIKGAIGFGKGTLLDLPETILAQGKDIHDRFNPISIAKKIINPIGAIKDTGNTINEQLTGMADTISNTEDNPEETGRLVGQLIGQPLLTAGLIKGGPKITRGAGSVLKGTGGIMKRHQPLTGMPIASMFAGRTLRNLERGVGGVIERIGDKMKKVGVKPPPESPIITNENLDNYKPPSIPQSDLGFSPNEPMNFPKTIITNEDVPNVGRDAASRSGYRNAPLEDNIPMEKSVITNEDLANVGEAGANRSGYRTNQVLEQLEGFPLTEGENLTPPITTRKVINRGESSKKPNLRLNKDGTFTNKDTGEIVNHEGNPIIEINGEPITRNSPFFLRNKLNRY